MQVLSNRISVEEYIQKKKWTSISEIRLRPSDGAIMLYIPQSKLAPRVSKEHTSLRQLNFIKRDLADAYSTSVDIILFRDDGHLELEAGFNQILNRKFKGSIVSLFLSFRHESLVDAFIEVSGMSTLLQNEIAVFFRSVLKGAEIQLGEIHWLESPLSLPTSIAILRMIKELQPLSLGELAAEIRVSYKSMTDKWLANKLDRLRKNGLVIWQKNNKTYVLTKEALSVVPAGARSTSSDIDRALALGKRKW